MKKATILVFFRIKKTGFCESCKVLLKNCGTYIDTFNNKYSFFNRFVLTKKIIYFAWFN
jgi:hypothetical protein